MDERNDVYIVSVRNYLCEEKIGDHGYYQVYNALQTSPDTEQFYGELYSAPLLLETYNFSLASDPQSLRLQLIDSIAESRVLRHHNIERLIDIDLFDKELSQKDNSGLSAIESQLYVASTQSYDLQLHSLLQSKVPLLVKEAHSILREVTSALTYSHQKGCFHGDLSSEWIFINGTCSSELTIAHWGASLSVRALKELNSLTLYHTRNYSPQRLRGAEITVKDDVFSLAALTFEMLTANHPFVDLYARDVYLPVDIETIFIARENRNLRVKLEKKYVDDDIIEVILRGLNEDPEKRYPTTLDFFKAFSEACGLPTEIQLTSVQPPEERGKMKLDPVLPACVEVPSPQESPGNAGDSSDEQYLQVSNKTPSSMGHEFFVAVILLIFSNIGWYLYHHDSKPESTYVAAENIQLETAPPGALLRERLPSGEEHVVGKTPLTVNLKNFARRQIRGSLSKKGFETMNLVISSDAKETTLVRVQLAED